MKNITGFTVLVIILHTLGLPGPAYGQTGQKKEDPAAGAYTFSIGPQFGIVYGQAREYVYPGPGNKGELLSELLWDMKPLYYYGAALDFSLRDPVKKMGGFYNLSCKIGIPGETGAMQDRDWRSIENTDLTDFSRHSNRSEYMLWVESAAGLSFPIESGFIIKIFAGVSFMRFDFSGHEGYGVYAREKPGEPEKFYPIDNEPNEIDFSGLQVITYTQKWLILSPGLSFDFRFLEYFSFDLSFQMSPLIFCNDTDHHLANRVTVQTNSGPVAAVTQDNVFTSYALGGLFMEPRAKLTFTAGRLTLSLEGGCRFISGSRGDTYTNGRLEAEDGAGTALLLLDAGILVKIRL
jgi:outer membrane protease